MQGKGLDYYIAAKRGRVQRLPKGAQRDGTRTWERTEAKVRTMV